MWAIPPPFSTSTETGPTWDGKLPQINASNNKIKVKHWSESNKGEAETPSWNTNESSNANDRSKHILPNKESVWLPGMLLNLCIRQELTKHISHRSALRIVQTIPQKATKHRHGYKGCAPNGFRLFENPPSLLLAKTKKKKRDQQLKMQLSKIEADVHRFETSNLGGGGPKSLAAVTAEHGRISSELREMKQVPPLESPAVIKLQPTNWILAPHNRWWTSDARAVGSQA